MTMDPSEIFLDITCPSMGVIMATIMFGAPIVDLRRALLAGSLGDLNPFPWAMMTGNCLGWVVYGYYRNHDPFLVAANLPGLILSLWLNSGAAKLQYQEYQDLKRMEQERDSHREAWDASPAVLDEGEQAPAAASPAAATFHPQQLVTVPQERALMRVLCFWSCVFVWTGWFDPRNAAATIGLMVNLNLIFFYGAPLQTMLRVVQTKSSASIHRPTMYMSWTNTSFWIMYGLAKMDPVIVVPNATGLTLGLVQGLLCFLYPNVRGQDDHEPIPLHDEDETAVVNRLVAEAED